MTGWQTLAERATPEPLDVFDVKPQSCSHDCDGCVLRGTQCPEDRGS